MLQYLALEDGICSCGLSELRARRFQTSGIHPDSEQGEFSHPQEAEHQKADKNRLSE